MRRALLLLVAAGCVEASDPPWQLDHDRIVAVRAEPPHIAPGESARLDALVAHRGAPTSDDPPVVATAVSPRELYTAVHYDLDHWQIDCPPVASVTPLVVEMRFPAGEVATKTVYLGDRAANPTAPTYAVPDPVPRHQDLALPAGEWFTSCGTLRDGTTWRVDEPCDGELAVVVRDGAGGVAWQVFAVHAP